MHAPPLLSLWAMAGLAAQAAATSVQLPMGADSALELELEVEVDPECFVTASCEPAPPYRHALLDLHRGLVDTASNSGREGPVGDWLVHYLQQRNYTVVRQPVPARPETPPGQSRFNVVAWFAEETDESETAARPASWMAPAKVLVTSHIDTVPPHIPYSIDVDDASRLSSSTVIHGRGSVDAKGSVAAQITAVEQLRQAGRLSAGDVALLFVVGEENSGDGMSHFSASLSRADAANEANEANEVPSSSSSVSSGFAAAIFGEPTENKLACGHKGILGCTIAATGRDGHSGYPWLGISANERLLRGLLAILDADLGYHPLFGNTTVNIGRLDGGVASNVIPAHAHADLAIRVAVAPQSSGHLLVRSRIEAALADVDADVFDLECSHGYGIVDCVCDVPDFETITVNYGTDVPHLAGHHKRYLYGPGTIFVAHSDHEALTVGDLETAVEGYQKLIVHALAESA